MYKLAFFVPESDLEAVKQALFSVGVGRIGDYDNCCWQVLGEGQFRPLAGSKPHIGNVGAVERLAEWKVEMVCSDKLIHKAVYCPGVFDCCFSEFQYLHSLNNSMRIPSLKP